LKIWGSERFEVRSAGRYVSIARHCFPIDYVDTEHRMAEKKRASWVIYLCHDAN
jgi:hypothetical protein